MDIGRLIAHARLPSPSPVALALFDVIDGGDAEDIAVTIESDPAITARLLKLANSASYGPGPIETVRDAVVRVGTLEVAALVLATEVMQVFGGIPVERFSMRGFWAHSLMTACLSRVLATPGGDQGRLWVCGLLHDIGKLLLVRHSPKEYGAVLDQLASGTPVLDTEAAILGFTHQRAGEALLCTWGLPEVFARCAGAHHRPYAALATPQDVVAAANDLANRKGQVDVLPGMTVSETGRVVAEAGEQYQRYETLFSEYL